ncbi:hypothetical protein AAIH20_34380, partial [Pseudomonas aeruginosa]
GGVVSMPPSLAPTFLQLDIKGALGSFSGSWLVGYLNGITGGPGASYLFMSGALLLSVLLTVFLNPHADKREPDAARAHASRRAAPAHP